MRWVVRPRLAVRPQSVRSTNFEASWPGPLSAMVHPKYLLRLLHYYACLSAVTCLTVVESAELPPGPIADPRTRSCSAAPRATAAGNTSVLAVQTRLADDLVRRRQKRISRVLWPLDRLNPGQECERPVKGARRRRKGELQTRCRRLCQCLSYMSLSSDVHTWRVMGCEPVA